MDEDGDGDEDVAVDKGEEVIIMRLPWMTKKVEKK